MTESAPSWRIRFADAYIDDASRDKEAYPNASQLSLLAGIIQAQVATAEVTRITNSHIASLTRALQEQNRLTFALHGHNLSTEVREHFKEVLGCE